MLLVQVLLERGPTLPGDESLGRLQRAWVAGRPAAFLVGGGLVALLALGGLLLAQGWRRAATALRLAPPLPPVAGLGLFLVAFGGLSVADGLVAVRLQARVVARGDDGAPPRELRPGPSGLPIGGPPPPASGGAPAPHLPLDGSGAPRGTLRAAELAIWLEVLPGPGEVSLDGQALEPGALVALRPGQRARVGPWELTVEGPGPGRTTLVLSGGQTACLALLLLALRAASPPGTLAALGLRSERLAAEVRRGARTWLGCLPLFALLLVATTGLLQLLGLRTGGHSLVRAIEREGLSLLLPVVVQAVLVAPLREELLFRGLLLPPLQRALGALPGLALSALLFAAVHGALGVALPMLLLGGLFGALRATAPDGSLVASITAHALHNGATLLLVGAILALG